MANGNCNAIKYEFVGLQCCSYVMSKMSKISNISTSVMSKNIEPGIINYVSLYQIQAKFTKLSQSTRKKFRQIVKLKIMQSLHHGRHCDHKTLKRAIPGLIDVPLK